MPAGSLDNWFAARANHASQLVEVVVFGDSTTDFGQDGNYPGWVELMRPLATADGYTDGGRGVADSGDTAAQSNEGLSVVGSRTGFATGSGSFDFFATGSFGSTTAGDIVTFQGYGTRCRLHFSVKSTTGGFSYSVDGGAAVVVETGPGRTVTGIMGIEIPLGADGLHEVAVTNLGGFIPGTPVISSSGVAVGTLAAGTYDYQVTVVDPLSGETLPSATATRAVGTNQGIALLMNTTPYGTQATFTYRVYRRQGSDPFALLTSFTVGGGNNQNFTDDGSYTPNLSINPPSVASSTRGGEAQTVIVTPEFVRDVGLVVHNMGVSGHSMNSYFGTLAGSPENSNWRAPVALGLSPSDPVATDPTTAVPVYVDGDPANNPLLPNPPYRNVSLGILNLGVNDQQGATDGSIAAAAQRVYVGAVQFAQFCRTVGADPLIVIPHFRRSVNAAAYAEQFRGALIQASRDQDTAAVDFDHALDVGGYVGGGPHLQQAGYDIEAAFIWDLLATGA